MILLEEIFKQYYDRWFIANTHNHKEDSYVRFMEIRTRGKTAYIRLFSYYPKTDKIAYLKITKLNHLSWIKIENINKEMEEKLNVLFTKALLTQHDKPTPEYIRST